MAAIRANKNWLRFRLRTLFVVVALAAVGLGVYRVYRWTQAPARTLQEFSALIEQERYEEAAARLECEHGYVISPGDLVHRVHVVQAVCNNYCQPRRRSFSDLIEGRQVLEIVGNQACFVDTGSVKAHFLIDSITVEGGKIRLNWRGPVPHQHLRYENGQWVRDGVVPPYWHPPRLTAGSINLEADTQFDGDDVSFSGEGDPQ